MGKSDSPQAKKEKTPIELDELQQLKAENLKLRIENAYLKELRRLRSEEEALLNGAASAI